MHLNIEVWPEKMEIFFSTELELRFYLAVFKKGLAAVAWSMMRMLIFFIRPWYMYINIMH